MQRVLLVGEFGCGNLGNEASLDAVLSWLDRAGPHEVVCVAREPERVSREHDIPAVSLYGGRRALPGPLSKLVAKLTDQMRMLSIVRTGDLVIVPGTGVMEQQLSGPPWGLPLTLAGLALAVRRRGARLALVGIGASADSRRSVRLLNRWVVRTADWVSVRDDLSRLAVVGYGADPATTRVAPDVAFSLPPGRPERAPSPADGPLRVGLGVLAYHDPGDAETGERVARRNEAEVTDFARRLLLAGHEVELLIGDAGDLDLARRVADHCRDLETVAVGRLGVAEPADYRSLVERCSDLDIVVGSRFHNLVFALLDGRPAMSVGYAPKSRALLETAGLSGASLRIEEADAEAMWTVFAAQVAQLPVARDAAAAYRTRAVADAERHRDDFLAAMGLRPAAVTDASEAAS